MMNLNFKPYLDNLVLSDWIYNSTQIRVLGLYSLRHIWQLVYLRHDFLSYI
ncbi:hypothetical protein HanIR_Chr11g0526351 [Helianthus annuus]|nr:hypothetical protein HanIR_Chr11g0526351 [Helianthus annuus]